VDLFRHVAMDGVANKVLPAKGRWSNMRTRHVGSSPAVLFCPPL
jgi:hypothetical protein